MQTVLYHWPKIAAITSKQATSLQSNPETWTYGVQLWGSESNSNLEILERFQSKVLQISTDAQWHVPNAVIKLDLHVLTAIQEVRNCSVTYRQKLDNHPNSLAKSLFQRTTCNRRLQRYCPADLATSF